MSSEEPFNYIDHKIKEAAKNHEIVFKESSWIKMEALLDKEPKRKPFIWLWVLLPILFVGGFGVLVSVNKPSIKEKFKTAQIEKKSAMKNSNDSSFTISANNKPLNKTSKTTVNNNNILNNSINNPSNIFKENKKTKRNIFSKTRKVINVNSPETTEDIVAQNENTFTKKAKASVAIKDGSTIENETVVDNNTILKKDSPKEIIKKEIAEKTKADTATLISKIKKETKKKQSTLSKIYLIGALGADVSSTKLFAFKNSKASLKYGLALGYNINKRLSVQTGFYAGKKKYIAKEGEYNFKTGSYYNLVRVTMVDANCLVFEIPVSVRYNILQKKAILFYSGVGLSSYIMKSEVYDVHFIRNYMPASRTWSYTGNQHFLSTLNISAGLEKRLTNKIALQIEPNVSIPLKGIGEGSVKLFSTNVQAGLKYTPFKK